MPSKNFPKRVLVTGREVGPIARLIKNYKSNNLKISIGAIDILGNTETRFFSDWKFSIEKQFPDTSIIRPKQRPIIDLLHELTLIMLEEMEFDLLIPLSPYHTKPEYLHQLSNIVEVNCPNNQILKTITSTYGFLESIRSKLPNTLSSPVYMSSLHDSTSLKFPSLFISRDKTRILYSKRDLLLNSGTNDIGYYFPFHKIHCALFTGCSQNNNFIGLQSLSSPNDHDFFLDHFEKNAMLPFSSHNTVSFPSIISFLSKIINILDLNGLITIYFGFNKEKIIPVSCSILPDENIDLWDIKCTEHLIQSILSPKNTHFEPSSYFAFKIPIYSSHPIRVPILPKEGVTQRNLVNVISHPSYPICSILGKSKSRIRLKNNINQKKSEILKALGANA
ncbi:MAG: hypothetical protein ACW98X_25765 [Promethearchaeota archaeon]|jgi:hypothetical protein